jgi:hypothetical protein
MSEPTQEPEQWIPRTLSAEQVLVIDSHRIPVDSSYPSTYWIACLNHHSALPTEAELRMIWSYIEYAVMSRYNETYQEKILAKRLPCEGGHVTKVFRKGGDWQHQSAEGWHYRHSLWENSDYWPSRHTSGKTLLECLDRISQWGDQPGNVNPAWQKWKDERPDIFPASGASL